jgi:acyl-CoA synthetase (NDP forming)
MSEHEQYVLEPETVQLLEEYGIPYPPHGLAHDALEAERIAEKLGYGVVLKVVSPDVVHKSDAGGVLLGLEDGATVRDGFEALVKRVRSSVPGARIEGALVCKEAPEGLEVIVGALEDATFGPTVMVGMGGVFTEVLRDVSFRVAPLEPRDAEEMIGEIRGYPLLTGARGQAPLDVASLAELLLSVSRLVTEHREIKELDLNPVRLYKDSLLVLDVRMMLKTDQE